MGTINIRRTFGANKVESGKYQTAVVSGGYIYRSTDYGVTWNQATSDTSRYWRSVAINK